MVADRAVPVLLIAAGLLSVILQVQQCFERPLHYISGHRQSHDQIICLVVLRKEYVHNQPAQSKTPARRPLHGSEVSVLCSHVHLSAAGVRLSKLNVK